MEVPSGGVTLRQGLYNGTDIKQELEGKTLYIELVFFWERMLTYQHL